MRFQYQLGVVGGVGVRPMILRRWLEWWESGEDGKLFDHPRRWPLRLQPRYVLVTCVRCPWVLVTRMTHGVRERWRFKGSFAALELRMPCEFSDGQMYVYTALERICFFLCFLPTNNCARKSFFNELDLFTASAAQLIPLILSAKIYQLPRHIILVVDCSKMHP